METKTGMLTSPWLEVMSGNAEHKIMSPLEALSQAASIHRIALSNPLDQFAALRFLLTLLYWKADLAGGVGELRESLLKEETPRKVLDALEKEAQHFRFFDKDQPFLQDPSLLKEKKLYTLAAEPKYPLDPSLLKEKYRYSAGSLLPELATGTNIAHFHHGDDKKMRLCLKCATLGMLNVVPWTQSGGAGLTPSAHGAPPIRAVALGKNLGTTLGLNLVPIAGESGNLKWTGHFSPADPKGPVPYLEALTWNPRRILLSRAGTQVCWRCGESGKTAIGQIIYMGNENTKKQSDKKPFEWQDPAAFYGEKDPLKAVTNGNEKDAACNKDIGNKLLKTGKRAKAVPQSSVVEKNEGCENWQLIIPCTSPKDNKTFDHRQLLLKGRFSDSVQKIETFKPHRRKKEMDGWAEPPNTAAKEWHKNFVGLAIELLSHSDWAALSSAARKDMKSAPGAFDIFTSLWWRLKPDKRPNSKSAGWLLLKLMAQVPKRYRTLEPDADFNPIESIPKRQLEGKKPRPEGNGKTGTAYPVAFPRGNRLEAELNRIIKEHTQKKNPARIDWAVLYRCLEQLVN